MPNVKRVADLTDYTSVLPYASEIFGVYQPLIGWKSRRKIDRIMDAVRIERNALLSQLSRFLTTSAAIRFSPDWVMSAPDLKPAGLVGPRLSHLSSIVMQNIQLELEKRGKVHPTEVEWAQFINEEILTNILQKDVVDYYNRLSVENGGRIRQMQKDEHETDHAFELRKARYVDKSHHDIRSAVQDEAVTAGVLNILREKNRIRDLNSIFFTNLDAGAEAAFDHRLARAAVDFDDPYLTFDPKKDVNDVSLSPLGIVHLYRQYFFELDTFLGTPIGHVWLSPGSTLELIEISTRKSITEKAIELTLETVVKSEKSTSDQDEISEAVKQDNKDDLKLGVTTTVNQSWGSGNASASASLSMDRTQQVARETTHKRMRQQSEKLSSEIRQNYKSTFKTISEVTDTSSKRYNFFNTTSKLINYELRRKMRQVGVQVQDIGSYLCWETFVDDPGEDIGLANLVHIAEPADLLPVPANEEVVYPNDRVKTFQVNARWTKTTVANPGFFSLTAIEVQPADEGFELAPPQADQEIPLDLISVAGEDVNEFMHVRDDFCFVAKYEPDKNMLNIGLNIPRANFAWDDNLEFVLGGALRYRVTDAKKKAIAAAVNAKNLAGQAITADNERKTKGAFVKAAKERIEFAASIKRRAFEDLREEERVIVYRRLIESLMTSLKYKDADDRSRHIFAELLNSIFDIDKMLYFVAPDWWKPRKHVREFLNINGLKSKLNDVAKWRDERPGRDNNYLITEKSAPAPLGSSLGWLLQLDGDNLRNAFLNAPWVKAVIPVRPGQEKAAMNWLQNAMVEGTEGLGPNDYYSSKDKKELEQIRNGLGLPQNTPVTLRNALDFLCIEVGKKHAESNKTKKFPNTEIDDDNKVTSTPIEKVFEHGFYPLKGGFRVDPNDSVDPNNTDRHFQVFDQWVEILPTDQVVPVEVEYDPKTGRQI